MMNKHKKKHMRIKQKQWMLFGRWMMVSSGIVCIALALYFIDSTLSMLLRIWGGLFGLYCVYLGLNG
jgi:hypothetical protein